MVQGFEKRTCHRFEIPDAQISYRKKKMFGFTEYSAPRLLINISKGGASFDCGEILNEQQRLIIRLTIPAKSRWNCSLMYAGSAKRPVSPKRSELFSRLLGATLIIIRRLLSTFYGNWTRSTLKTINGKSEPIVWN
jgi:hypothetical protein